MNSRRAAHVLVSLLVTVPAFADVRFHAAPAYASGDYSAAAAVIGDFNEDGSNDVALAKQATGVLIMLGSPGGQLVQGPAFPAGDNAVHVAAGDVNGDGHLDLAIANAVEAGQITIAIGVGDGTFGPAPAVPVGRYPVSVAVGDLNGDGIPDLAAANAGSGDVTVLLGQGDGTFDSRADYGTGVEPRAMVSADLNGDGHGDIAVANRRTGGVSVLLNDGAGLFVSAPNVALDAALVFLAATDFNGDAHQDLAVTDINGDLFIALGHGDGTFAAPSVEAAIGGGFVTADLTGDGIVDLAAVNPIAQQLAILRGIGDGHFAVHATYGVQIDPRFLVAGHLDSDAHLDLAIPRWNVVAVVRGLGGGAFVAARWMSAGTRLTGRPRLGDLNNDGAADLVVGATAALTVHLGTGGGSFGPPERYEGRAADPALADFNGDGNLDVVTSQSIRLGAGNGTLGPAVPIVFPRGTTSVAVADFDLDGLLDLAASGAAATTFIAGNGDGTFDLPVAIAAGSRSVVAADFDGDGRQDVAFAYPHGSPDGVAVLLGNGDGTFALRTFLPGGLYQSITPADFNSDGVPDIALTRESTNESESPHRLVVVLGNGDGTFRLSFLREQYDLFSQSLASDFDGDGNQDLVVMEEGGLMRVFAGDGEGGFVEGASYAGAGAAAAGDYDGDGKEDVVATEINFGVMLHRNVSP